MQRLGQKLVVVGGNGFIGSAVCKVALARGLDVTSISSSGRPYQTPKGHTPAWASKVTWHKADAHAPESYADILAGASGVVHTLGTLLEDARYKTALRDGDLFGVLKSLTGGANPLEMGGKDGYDAVNRDSALRVCETFVESAPHAKPDGLDSVPRPFIYISAEDVFRPVIPARYIESKREAEQGIDQITRAQPGFRGVYIRPSLVYHPHYRPLTSPLAALLDLSATLHANAPPSLPTPASILRTLGSTFSSPAPSVANALTIPPIHVEHVAEAVVCAALDADVQGVLGVRAMRELIGWAQKGDSGRTHLGHV
ncbi:hypothetical protein PLICRDRAFT_54232 [Plicaturopsis crispa FD-325 SS-3]|nr:hypothetical protein PLICRDRAFT_54232 [Plicaturopsis crispa FD-325 SS-3]